MKRAKQFIKRLVPRSILQWRQKIIEKRYQEQVQVLPHDVIFEKLYRDGFWGKSDNPEQKFFSGSGSHNPEVVGVYVAAVKSFLDSFPSPPDVVDLGCGDFAVGQRIRHLCGGYIAGDIVKPLIDWNRETHKDLNVDFRVIDLIKDPLPPGDIVFLRQVLQHLSNQHISEIIPRLAERYKYLVLTEHLPGDPKFRSNLDKNPGPSIRLEFGSGIVLTDAPFSLKVAEQKILCEAPEYGGVIRTIAYRF